MHVLKATVSPVIKRRFHATARACGQSEAELLRCVVLAHLGQGETDLTVPVPSAEAQWLERLTVRLPHFLMQATRDQARRHQMAPSRWIGALVQSTFMRAPVMTDEQLLTLKASNRELAAIGRNINQIARALNEAFFRTHKLERAHLDALANAIVNNRTAIRDLVRASQQAWGNDQ